MTPTDTRAPDRDADAGRRWTFLHVAPSFGAGGREMRAVELMGMLGPGVRHRLFAHDGRYDALARCDAAVDQQRVDAVVDGAFPSRLRAMREVLRAEAPDLLLTYNWGAIEWLFAARLSGLDAVVHHEDGFGPEETERRLLRRSLARRVVLRYAQAVVVPSARLAEIARREWGAGGRLVHLPNGVDTVRFAPARRRRDGGETVFVCVGALRPEKNQVLAVEALARASCRARSRLLVVGDGPDRELIRARATALGVQDRVDLVGAVHDTAPEYRRADVFVIPSRTEQMPLSLLEAMASGLPVVGADVGDVRAMVADDNHRWIVPPGDAPALARAMDEAALDPAACAALGTANRARVEREYERSACYGRYCALYRRVARGIERV